MKQEYRIIIQVSLCTLIAVILSWFWLKAMWH